ncbi:hypothetical protein NARC_50119 [Candidatus Nitrosocosmicus arcticus]|uniref:Uncharacterized protein n=1 Tax=Candidatus Nitrosocosmicus arcticus TaxID=2035267 RepID=A0A557SWF8_9ARCH|nr:hypothetical protein NARC_50119 [Candidatus Nitrosocosmicus arcticus]
MTNLSERNDQIKEIKERTIKWTRTRISSLYLKEVKLNLYQRLPSILR